MQVKVATLLRCGQSWHFGLEHNLLDLLEVRLVTDRLFGMETFLEDVLGIDVRKVLSHGESGSTWFEKSLMEVCMFPGFEEVDCG